MANTPKWEEGAQEVLKGNGVGMVGGTNHVHVERSFVDGTYRKHLRGPASARKE